MLGGNWGYLSRLKTSDHRLRYFVASERFKNVCRSAILLRQPLSFCLGFCAHEMLFFRCLSAFCEHHPKFVALHSLSSQVPA